jgi:hypothetical protein
MVPLFTAIVLVVPPERSVKLLVALFTAVMVPCRSRSWGPRVAVGALGGGAMEAVGVGGALSVAVG